MLRTKIARKEHIADIMAIIEMARTIMQECGNAHQWTNGYPNKDTITNDIEGEDGFVIEDDDGKIVAYYAFKSGPAPNCQTIKDGQWFDSGVNKLGRCSYSVIHRIASLPNVHGVFDEIMRHCTLFSNNIRIDTHRDNHIMQHLVEKYGFVYCGIIFTEQGDERLAYQRLTETAFNEDEWWVTHLGLYVLQATVFYKEL